MFFFSLQLLPQTFLILRRTERDIIKILHESSCKVPITLVIFQLSSCFLDRFSRNV